MQKSKAVKMSLPFCIYYSNSLYLYLLSGVCVSVEFLFFVAINETTKNDTWIAAQKASENALETLVQKQGKLEPVYNPEDSTELAIEKATRGEILIDELRNELEEIVNATYAYNATRTFVQQKKALLALSYLGELLVKEFPYIVPSKGKFSYLPRLLGRAKVTFRMKRGNSILGNITIIADGYAGKKKKKKRRSKNQNIAAFVAIHYMKAKRTLVVSDCS